MSSLPAHRVRPALAGFAIGIVLAGFSACASGPGEEFAEIELERLRDKAAGGWAGQMIGVSYGWPTEFRFNDRIIEKELDWSPERVRDALRQDDLYVDMTFVKVLDRVGPGATTEDFGEEFKNSQYRLWHANLAARRALRRGVPAALSGTPRFNAHANDIDFQIEADFAGLMSPGMPNSSTDLCMRAGRVMNYGDGIYGGVFVSAMYAAAFFVDDPRRIVEAGLESLPPESRYAQVIADTLRWSSENPEDWRAVWRQIEDKWAQPEACPGGALQPFNIDAAVNGAYVATGLLYGGGDFGKTVEITTRLGKDSDCNPASSAGILGVVLGYEAIPELWKSGIEAIADEKFDFTDYSFRTIVDSTVERAIRLAEREGGHIDGGTLSIRLQAPRPPALEQWNDWGAPSERIPVDDARWSFSGNWEQQELWGRLEGWLKSANEKGAAAEVAFEGAGAILLGPLLPSGGKAEIFLDGESVAVVDSYQDGEPRGKPHEAIWHNFDLPPGEHTLRVVVLGEPVLDSPGSDVSLEGLIVFERRSG